MIVADREYGFNRIINERNYKIGIEIGVRHGKYSAWLLEHTCLEKLYSLDMFPYPDMYPITIDNLFKFGERSQVCIGTTPEYSLKFKDEYFDYIYIDANHSYQAVLKDLSVWWPKLKSGGLFCGDDYTHVVNPGDEGKYGVVEAVNQFVKDYNLKLYITGIENHTKQERERIATMYGKIVEADLRGKIDVKMGHINDGGIGIPQWFIFKE